MNGNHKSAPQPVQHTGFAAPTSQHKAAPLSSLPPATATAAWDAAERARLEKEKQQNLAFSAQAGLSFDAAARLMQKHQDQTSQFKALAEAVAVVATKNAMAKLSPPKVKRHKKVRFATVRRVPVRFIHVPSDLQDREINRSWSVESTHKLLQKNQERLDKWSESPEPSKTPLPVLAKTAPRSALDHLTASIQIQHELAQSVIDSTGLPEPPLLIPESGYPGFYSIEETRLSEISELLEKGPIVKNAERPFRVIQQGSGVTELHPDVVHPMLLLSTKNGVDGYLMYDANEALFCLFASNLDAHGEETWRKVFCGPRDLGLTSFWCTLGGELKKCISAYYQCKNTEMIVHLEWFGSTLHPRTEPPEWATAVPQKTAKESAAPESVPLEPSNNLEDCLM
jgi:hypothetical protein